MFCLNIEYGVINFMTIFVRLDGGELWGPLKPGGTNHQSVIWTLKTLEATLGLCVRWEQTLLCNWYVCDFWKAWVCTDHVIAAKILVDDTLLSIQALLYKLKTLWIMWFYKLRVILTLSAFLFKISSIFAYVASSQNCTMQQQQKRVFNLGRISCNGPYRGTIKKKFNLRAMMNDLRTLTANSVKMLWINKIHGLFHNDSREFEPILISILSFLLIQEAAKTSLLSRSWKFLWLFLPRVYLGKALGSDSASLAAASDDFDSDKFDPKRCSLQPITFFSAALAPLITTQFSNAG